MTAARVVFLGGVGEIGRNMMVVESEGRILVIDAGLSFPSEEQLGVDLVLPDFSYVSDRAEDCVGVVLTHGHEDHVGALTWFLREVPVPVFGTPLTLGMASKRLAEWDIEAEFVRVDAPGRRKIGPFDVRFLAVSHSIPDAVAVAVDTSEGRILYTSDFKLDDDPIDGRRTDIEGFRALGAEGVDLMLGDSTNAEEPGRTPSETVVGERLQEIFSDATQRIVVACFASNLHRIQQVCDAAVANDRIVSFVGRSMVANVEVGRDLGYLKVPDGVIVDIEEVQRFSPSQTVIVCTGSQGEPLSALALIAAGEHKFVEVESGDTLILSASAIPGNEPAVHRVLNAFYKAGADVYYSEIDAVHVSGHGASDELREMLETVRPRHFVPVHGEFRHLSLHAKLARRAGVPEDRILVIEDGDVLELEGGLVTKGESIEAGMVFVDGLGVGDVGPVVLRDRHHLGQDGFVMCVVTIDGQSGEVLAGPDLITRGFVFEEESRDLLQEASDRVADSLKPLERDQVTDWTVVKRACRRALGEFVWEQTRRRPMIVPVVMEV